jgi:hypothetical protein
MPKYIGYSAPVESRGQSRERWRKVYMKTYVTKWLLLSIACVIMLTVIALWGWWEREPIWWYPVAVAVFGWLYFAGVIALLRIRGWQSYVSTIMYMEAIEDGLCRDRPSTLGGCGRWYKEHGSPWRLQPVPKAMRVHQGAKDWPLR